MKMRRTDYCTTEAPGECLLEFDSTTDRDRAMRIIEAIEWLSKMEYTVISHPQDEGEQTEWEIRNPARYGSFHVATIRDDLVDAILAAKQAAEGDGNG